VFLLHTLVFALIRMQYTLGTQPRASMELTSGSGSVRRIQLAAALREPPGTEVVPFNSAIPSGPAVGPELAATRGRRDPCAGLLQLQPREVVHQ